MFYVIESSIVQNIIIDVTLNETKIASHVIVKKTNNKWWRDGLFNEQYYTVALLARESWIRYTYLNSFTEFGSPKQFWFKNCNI